MRLGVVWSGALEKLDRCTKLGDQPYTWGYCYEGTEPDVEFVLDLTGSGTLSASFGCGRRLVLFSNMKAELSTHVAASSDHSGFVPAVFLFNRSRVRFLGFE